jgi:hypothetical protein
VRGSRRRSNDGAVDPTLEARIDAAARAPSFARWRRALDTLASLPQSKSSRHQKSDPAHGAAMSLLKDLKGKAGQSIDVTYLSTQVEAKRRASFDDEAKALKTVTFTLPGGGAAAAAATLQALLNASAFIANGQPPPLPPTSTKRKNLIDLILRYFEPVAPQAPVVHQYSTKRADDQIRKFSQAFAWKHVAASVEGGLTKATQRNLAVATLIPKAHAERFALEIDALAKAGVYAAVLKWLDGQKSTLKLTGQAVEEVLYRSKDLYPIWTFTKQPNNSFARTDSYSAIIYAMTETEETGKLVCNHYDAVSALQDGVLSDKVPGGYSPLDPSELGRNLPEGMRNAIIEATKGETDKEGLRIFVKMGRR